MSECQNLEVRDLLPLLARAELKSSQRAAVEEHLAECAACRAELELVRHVASALLNAASIDTARVAQGVVRTAREQREAPVSLDAVRRGRAAPRRVWLAAASLIAVAGAATLAVVASRDEVGSPPAADVVRNDAPVDVPAAPENPAQAPLPDPVRGQPRAVAGTELVMGGGVSDLADTDLESLLGVLEGLDPAIEVEPAVLLPLLEGDV